MATTISDQRQYMALERIRVPENVRPLDLEHVDWLAGSIELLGILVPVVVRGDGADFELVAGFHRIAAAQKLGLAEVPYVVRDAETGDADRAVENIARKQLTPYEEARALHAMLARGLTEDGAAQALGWPKQRVTARVKLLALPERAQEMVGAGVLPLAAVDVLRAIGEVSKPIQQLVIDYLDHDETHWLCERLLDEPGFVIGRAINEIGTKDVWAAFLNGAPRCSIEDLKLGKKIEALHAEAEKLHKQVNQYAYGPPEIRFTEADVDQARAAGVLIELEHGSPIITDRALYRELVKGAVKRTVEDLRAKATAAAEQKRTAGRSAEAPVDPVTAAKRDRDAQLRQLADQAHGANLDLGASLLNGLSAVDPADMDVARFLVLCGHPHRTNYADGLAMPMSGASVLGTRLRRSESGERRSSRVRRGSGPTACWVG
jgi:ParB/RepB/Spo0J family partition protein